MFLMEEIYLQANGILQAYVLAILIEMSVSGIWCQHKGKSMKASTTVIFASINQDIYCLQKYTADMEIKRRLVVYLERVASAI